jgi:hypothetical protein
MLRLYHASPSVAPVMVRIVLHEKGLPWESKILDLLRGDQFQPEYRKINPKAVVPTLRKYQLALDDLSLARTRDQLNDAAGCKAALRKVKHDLR